jgi:hypothetical protein
VNGKCEYKILAKGKKGQQERRNYRLRQLAIWRSLKGFPLKDRRPENEVKCQLKRKVRTD